MQFQKQDQISAERTASALVRQVLVVDDSKLQRKILSSSLKRWGYSVIEADCAEDALEICQERQPDIVLSDWMMPGMTGPEFCAALRDCALSSYAYFILLTSKSEKAAIALGLEAGADDFLTKPVDGHELNARIKAGLRLIDMQTRLKENNRALADALREVERLNDELDGDLREARQLQQSLVPERHRNFETCDVSLLLKSSGYVGGDLVGVYQAGPDHIGMYAVDVSGHGISAALMTARLAGYLSPNAPDQNVALHKDEDGTYGPVPPAQAISTLNTLVLEEMETEHYFTMLLGALNLKTGVLQMGQAGHPHPVVQRADGTITQESPGGFPVGLLPNAEFSEFEIKLGKGDRVLFHSDGITECPNEKDDMLGEDGLGDLIDELSDLVGSAFLEALMWRLSEFRGSGQMPDDVSAVLLDFKG